MGTYHRKLVVEGHFFNIIYVRAPEPTPQDALLRVLESSHFWGGSQDPVGAKIWAIPGKTEKVSFGDQQ